MLSLLVSLLWWASGIVILIVTVGNLKMLVEAVIHLRAGRLSRIPDLNTNIIDFNVKMLPVFGVALLVIALVGWPK